MSEDFEQRIQQKHALLDQVRSEMAWIQEEFCETAARHAAPWYRKQAASTVEREHSITSKLTDSQLTAMKAEVEEAAANSRAAIDEALASPRLWWHLQEPLPKLDKFQKRPEDPWRYTLYGARQPDFIDKALRFAFGKIGVVLEKYGYLRSQERDRGDAFEWRERDHSGPRSAGQPYYPYNVGWSSEMRQVMDRYATKQDDANQLVQDIAAITEEKRRAEAKNRWSSA